MNIDDIRNYLFTKIKENILNGNITGINQIPDDSTVYSYIDDILNKSNNGIIGSLNTLQYKEVSNSSNYNHNFITIKDNIEYILSSLFDKLNQTIDIINDSRIEHNKITRDVKLINRDFNDIEQGSIHKDGLKYIVTDTFIDTDKIDLVRTNALINLNAGSVSLNIDRSNYVSFPHYKNQKSINFTITEGYDKVLSQQQTPESFFGGIFDSDYTDRWEVVVTTKMPTMVEGYITLKLSDIGESVKINSIIMKTDYIKSITKNTDLITFQYTNVLSTNKWTIIPGGKIELTSTETELNFSEIEATHIRIYWTKYYPDNNNNQYKFSFIEIIVKQALTVYESTLVTNAIEIEPYRNETPCIYSVELNTKNKIIDNSNIKYYVAVDDPVDGKIVDNEGNITTISSDNAYAFVPNSVDDEGKLETYYTYASLLRDNPHISGALIYQNWQPKWQEISSDNNKIPKTLFFNISDFNKNTHDLYYTNPITWGDSNYTGPWPATGSEWASAWSGGIETFPKSGYIWGENPFKTAGVWWGDSSEYPGWWRPSTPTASGTFNYPVEDPPIPDYIIPVVDSNDNPVFDDLNNPIQKHFWKIFKWPAGYKPINSSVKLYNNFITKSDLSIVNNINWKWNYRYKKNIEDYTVNVTLSGRDNYYVIKTDTLLSNKSDVRIIQDSIRDVKFVNYTPSDIFNYSVEYGFEYEVDETTGLTVRKESTEAYKDSRATIIFSETDLNPVRINNGSSNIIISLTFSYESRSDISASWDGYIIVPEQSNETKLRINTINDKVNKISVQQIDDNGIVLNSMSVDDYSNIKLYKGLNFIRFFVDTLQSQTGVIDESLAEWRPDDYKIISDDSYLYQNEINESIELVNKIMSTTNNFINDGLVKGVPIIVNNTIEAKIKNVYNIGSKYYIDLLINDNIIVNTYSIFNFTSQPSLEFDGDVADGSTLTPLTEVDINTLLYEVQYNDDTKYSLLEEVDGSTYLIVKTPSLNNNKIINNIHYNRTYFDVNLNKFVTFTTGTSGNINDHPVSLDGVILSDKPANTIDSVEYANISTYDKVIQTYEPSDKGFLFWNTAENLETVYDIKYSIASNNKPVNRLFLMAKLISNDNKSTPILNSYSLIINNNIEV